MFPPRGAARPTAPGGRRAMGLTASQAACTRLRLCSTTRVDPPARTSPTTRKPRRLYVGNGPLCPRCPENSQQAPPTPERHTPPPSASGSPFAAPRCSCSAARSRSGRPPLHTLGKSSRGNHLSRRHGAHLAGRHRCCLGCMYGPHRHYV
ncbi:hypothetical protein B0H11DRAFT_2093309 [Mycena galericulata]|nr:hypothetical protein B0H11DRAFT_2093309 [Mycena galericulata]